MLAHRAFAAAICGPVKSDIPTRSVSEEELRKDAESRFVLAHASG